MIYFKTSLGLNSFEKFIASVLRVMTSYPFLVENSWRPPPPYFLSIQIDSKYFLLEQIQVSGKFVSASRGPCYKTQTLVTVNWANFILDKSTACFRACFEPIFRSFFVFQFLLFMWINLNPKLAELLSSLCLSSAKPWLYFRQALGPGLQAWDLAKACSTSRPQKIAISRLRANISQSKRQHM